MSPNVTWNRPGRFWYFPLQLNIIYWYAKSMLLFPIVSKHSCWVMYRELIRHPVQNDFPFMTEAIFHCCIKCGIAGKCPNLQCLSFDRIYITKLSCTLWESYFVFQALSVFAFCATIKINSCIYFALQFPYFQRKPRMPLSESHAEYWHQTLPRGITNEIKLVREVRDHADWSHLGGLLLV